MVSLGTITRFIALVACCLCGESLFAHGDLHKQIEDISTQLLKDSKNPQLLAKRANLYRQHQEWANALDDIERLRKIRRCPEDLYLLGLVQYESGKLPEAKHVFDELLAEDKSNPAILIARAKVLASMREFEPAARDYSTALPLLKSPDPDLFLEQAKCFVELEKPAKALETLDQGITRLGIIPALQLRAIDLEKSLSNYNEALRRIGSLEKNGIARIDLQLLRGEILLQAGREAEAREVFETALANLHKNSSKPTARSQAWEQSIRTQLAKISNEKPN